jgi:hypothetical protein
MKQDEIIELVQEAGIVQFNDGFIDVTKAELDKFAKLVAEAEREACAKECWKQMGLLPTQAWTVNPYEQCIDAIRARGQA